MVKNSKSIAIITARGGSKRIPRKNIRFFHGRPIIAYPIEVAIKSGCFDKVMVSTDDVEIAELANQLGAEVPFLRSEKTSDDHATTAQVLQEVFSNYSKLGEFFDLGCCIYPTAVLTTADQIKEAHDLLLNRSALSVLPVVRYSSPIQRAFRMKNQLLSYLHPENSLIRSQDLEPTYHDAGQFYFFDVSKFLEEGQLINSSSLGIPLCELRTQDIDNDDDWKLAELKWLHLKNKEPSSFHE